MQGSFQAPSLVLSEDFCNTLDQDAHFEFKKSKKTSSDCSWTVTNGMSSDTSVSFKVGVPTLAETSFSESISLNYATTQGQSVTHEDDWEIDNYIPVPAHQYVKATFTVIETDFSTTWSSKIKLRGCVHVKFHDKLNDHWLWWYSINDVYGNVPGFNCWFDDSQ